jgi:hypothetical protein
VNGGHFGLVGEEVLPRFAGSDVWHEGNLMKSRDFVTAVTVEPMVKLKRRGRNTGFRPVRMTLKHWRFWILDAVRTGWKPVLQGRYPVARP